MDIQFSRFVVQCSGRTCMCSALIGFPVWLFTYVLLSQKAGMKQNAFQDMVQLLSLDQSRIVLSEGIK